MRILNATRKTVLAETMEIADSSFRKAKGLMFRESLEKGHGLLMTFGNEGKHSIWMFGMRFPIDVIYIGNDYRIVHLERDFRPLGLNPKTWKVSVPKEKCRYVLEVGKGTIDRSGSKIGDIVKFGK